MSVTLKIKKYGLLAIVLFAIGGYQEIGCAIEGETEAEALEVPTARGRSTRAPRKKTAASTQRRRPTQRRPTQRKTVTPRGRRMVAQPTMGASALTGAALKTKVTELENTLAQAIAQQNESLILTGERGVGYYNQKMMGNPEFLAKRVALLQRMIDEARVSLALLQTGSVQAKGITVPVAAPATSVPTAPTSAPAVTGGLTYKEAPRLIRYVGEEVAVTSEGPKKQGEPDVKKGGKKGGKEGQEVTWTAEQQAELEAFIEKVKSAEITLTPTQGKEADALLKTLQPRITNNFDAEIDKWIVENGDKGVNPEKLKSYILLKSQDVQQSLKRDMATEPKKYLQMMYNFLIQELNQALEKTKAESPQQIYKRVVLEEVSEEQKRHDTSRLQTQLDTERDRAIQSVRDWVAVNGGVNVNERALKDRLTQAMQSTLAEFELQRDQAQQEHIKAVYQEKIDQLKNEITGIPAFNQAALLMGYKLAEGAKQQEEIERIQQREQNDFQDFKQRMELKIMQANLKIPAGSSRLSEQDKAKLILPELEVWAKREDERIGRLITDAQSARKDYLVPVYEKARSDIRGLVDEVRQDAGQEEEKKESGDLVTQAVEQMVQFRDRVEQIKNDSSMPLTQKETEVGSIFAEVDSMALKRKKDLVAPGVGIQEGKPDAIGDIYNQFLSEFPVWQQYVFEQRQLERDKLSALRALHKQLRSALEALFDGTKSVDNGVFLYNGLATASQRADVLKWAQDNLIAFINDHKDKPLFADEVREYKSALNTLVQALSNNAGNDAQLDQQIREAESRDYKQYKIK